MPHLVFDLTVSPSDDARRRFGAAVARRFGEIMDTGTDHVAVLVRAHLPGSLQLGLARTPERGVALASADIRLGRTPDQERRLCLAFIEELGSCFGIPPDQVYVVITRHDGPEFQLHDRVLPSWSAGEDPLEGAKPARRRPPRRGPGSSRRGTRAPPARTRRRR